MPRFLSFAAVLLAFVAVYLLARVPLLSTPLEFEEGIFADIVVHDRPGPAYLLIGRLNGEPIFDRPRHPAAMYEALRAGGALVRPWYVNARTPTRTVTPRLRLFHSLIGLPVWAALGLWAWRRGDARQRRPALMLVAAAAVTPLALMSSTQLQIDGSIGVLLVGPVALALLLCAGATHLGRRGLAMLAAAAFVAGLGKQEWSLALAAGVLGWLTVHLVQRCRGRAADRLTAPLGMALLAGLAAGNLVSYACDSYNWIGGLAVMTSVGSQSTITTGHGLWQWWHNTLARASALFGVLAILAAIGLALWLPRGSGAPRPATHPAAAVLGLFGVCLFGGFFVASCGADPRYFAPALVVLTAAALALLPRAPARPLPWALGLVAAALLAHSLLFLGGYRLLPPKGDWVPIPAAARAGRCVPMLSTGQAWNLHDQDFVSNALTPEEGRRLAENRGRSLCEPGRDATRSADD